MINFVMYISPLVLYWKILHKSIYRVVRRETKGRCFFCGVFKGLTVSQTTLGAKPKFRVGNLFLSSKYSKLTCANGQRSTVIDPTICYKPKGKHSFNSTRIGKELKQKVKKTFFEYCLSFDRSNILLVTV